MKLITRSSDVIAADVETERNVASVEEEASLNYCEIVLLQKEIDEKTEMKTKVYCETVIVRKSRKQSRENKEKYVTQQVRSLSSPPPQVLNVRNILTPPMLMIPLGVAFRKPKHHLPVFLSCPLLLNPRHRLPHVRRRVASPMDSLVFVENTLMLVRSLGMGDHDRAAFLAARPGGGESGVHKVMRGKGWGQGGLKGRIEEAREIDRIARARAGAGVSGW